MQVDHVLVDARIATMAPDGDPYGSVADGAAAAVAIAGDRIAWVGPMADLPTGLGAARRTGLDGRWITPGLIDCHTHLVHGGDRAHEFELRLEGASYEELARAGGGILSTVRATRAASEADLLASALPRLDGLIAEGATTVEIKSGYGLSVADEVKMLRVARELGRVRPVTTRTTLLAAHALPPEFADDPEGYIDLCAGPILDAVAAEGLADAVDAFCDRIGFTAAQTARVFTAARARGLAIKLHAEQLSDQGGAALAAGMGALSADHLEYLDEAGAIAMARAGTVAVLLPGAFYFIRETRLPPVDLLRRLGVPIAISTDLNPGSSPLNSPLLAMNMACTLFRLTPAEALAGMTRHAATALGMGGDTGTIAPGRRADLAIWSIERPAELAYRIGFNPLYRRIWGGK
ncbi:imidazolonepropionase [Stella humosa]|uniref:Imidazolonepropionase n=2 Tax=Stella humosa TaxID=94 RepID=A0A3N1KVC9_9PROT|nr:imidazolonepropionase [Stella humosa]ROP83207.1 imidazolonepropionase [Stella humosa]BBK30014.1 imidazolonepropionase [Stella humosa]